MYVLLLNICISLNLMHSHCVTRKQYIKSEANTHCFIVEENAEREQLIKELESELELLRIEYETVRQQRQAKYAIMP